MATAESRYRALESDRNYYLDRARQAAKLTVPYLIPTSNEPQSGNKEAYPVPWNGIGARGVLNLASRMLLSLLPPTQTFFRFSLDEAELTRQGVDPRAKSEFEVALSKIERDVLRAIEASNDRVAFHEALLHLVVGGNALLYLAPEGLRVFHLNRYVCSRDSMGNPLEVVTCEELPIDSLPKKVQDMVRSDEEDELKGMLDDREPIETREDEKTVRLYTYVEWEWDEKKVCWHQEVKGQVVPGTEGKAPIEKCPWLPLRMTRVDGQPYGIGYVEAAAIADLQTVEALTQAMAEGSLASSKVLFLVKPSGVTRAKDLADAPNGSFVQGDPNDVLALQVQKAQDLSVAMQGLARIEARLAQAFMLADVRDSERTTAEEVRLQALQIENSLGSIYSILTTEFQLPYVRAKLEILTRQKKVPPLPDELVSVVMTVGLAAVGRGNDLEQIVRFCTTLGQTMGPEALSTYVEPSELIRRMAYSMGLDTLGLIKPEEQVQQERQAMQQAAAAQQMMASPMADPQKLAVAASTAQQMQAPPEQPTEPPA